MLRLHLSLSASVGGRLPLAPQLALNAVSGQQETVRVFRGPNARLAQSAERKALNLVVVGSSPTVGAFSSARTSQVQVKSGAVWRNAARSGDVCGACKARMLGAGRAFV